MLKLMRTHATSWVIKIILGAIVLVFVFWGVGTFSSRPENKAATVNGEVISQEDYRESYNNLLEQYRQRFGGNLNEDMLKMLNLKKQALDQLIDRNLMRREALKLDFRVSDKEIADFVQKTEAFQENGAFNERKYKNILAYHHLTPEKFESLQKDAMLTDKLRALIINNVKVSDEEAREWYKWNDASVRIDYALFKPDKYQDIKPTDEEVTAYFDKNKTKYKTEAKVRIEFLHFKPDIYSSRVTVTDEEIREYYENNAKEFENPKKVSARHIMIKVDKGSDANIIEEKKKKAVEVYEKVKAGGDFTELAKTHSEDPGSKDKGGELGEFTQDRMVKPFADKAFSMNAGEISEPVLTDFGWHIIKVEKVTEASTTSLDDAKEKIRKKMTDDRAKSLAYDEAEAVYGTLPRSEDMAKAVQAKNLTVVKTEFLERKDILEKKDKYNGIENRSKLATLVFSLNLLELSEIEDLGDGYYIVQVLEKIPEATAEFKDVAEKVKAELTKEKQNEKAEKDAKDFLDTLKKGVSLEEAGKTAGVEVKATDFFSRNKPIPVLGNEREVSENAFNLSLTKKFPENPVKSNTGWYVIAFKEKKEPDAEGFDKEKDNIKKRLLQQKQSKAFESWLSQIRSKSEIIREKEFAE